MEMQRERGSGLQMGITGMSPVKAQLRSKKQNHGVLFIKKKKQNKTNDLKFVW